MAALISLFFSIIVFVFPLILCTRKQRIRKIHQQQLMARSRASSRTITPFGEKRIAIAKKASCNKKVKDKTKRKKNKTLKNLGAPDDRDSDYRDLQETQVTNLTKMTQQLADTQIDDNNSTGPPNTQPLGPAKSTDKARAMKNANPAKQRKKKKEEFMDDQNDDDTLVCVKSIENDNNN